MRGPSFACIPFVAIQSRLATLAHLRGERVRVQFAAAAEMRDVRPKGCWHIQHEDGVTGREVPGNRRQLHGDRPRSVDNPSFVCRIVASTEKMYGHIWLVANNPTIMARCYVEDVAAFHFDHASIVHGCSGSS